MIKGVDYLFSDLFRPEMGSQVIVFLFGLLLLLRLFELLMFSLPKKTKSRQLRRVVKKAPVYTINRLFKIVNNFSGNESYDEKYNFEGMYVLYNQTKNKYFVGSSERVMDGLMLHVVGEGYEGIHTDVKSGDEFEVRFVSIRDTQCDDIDDLWYAGVRAFKSNIKRRGYN